MAFADHAPAYGYGPQYHCRDTNTSVYAEVCVPAFTTKVTPIELAVKVVQDADYCYDQIVTVCTAADAIEQHELCTYSYAPLVSDLTGTVTQVCKKIIKLCQSELQGQEKLLTPILRHELRGSIPNVRQK